MIIHKCDRCGGEMQKDQPYYYDITIKKSPRSPYAVSTIGNPYANAAQNMFGTPAEFQQMSYEFCHKCGDYAKKILFE